MDITKQASGTIPVLFRLFACSGMPRRPCHHSCASVILYMKGWYTYEHIMTCVFSACHNRVFAKLADWEPESIEMVGREAIPGLTHTEVLPFMHHAKALPIQQGGCTGLLQDGHSMNVLASRQDTYTPCLHPMLGQVM